MPLCSQCGENVSFNRTRCTHCGSSMGSRSARLQTSKSSSSNSKKHDERSSFENELLNSMTPLQFLAFLFFLFCVWRFGKEIFWFLAGDRPFTVGVILVVFFYGAIRSYFLVRKWYEDSYKD